MNPTNWQEITPQMIAMTYRQPPPDAHKGIMGHALLIAGRYGMAGCALLAGESCLRSGAGKVTLLSHPSNRIILQAGLPEAILVMQKPQDITMFQAIGIGPGLSSAFEQMMYELMNQGRTMVLDADALNSIALRGSLLGHGHILTPHIGEMMRLAKGLQLPDGTPHEQALFLATQWQCHVVLKGHPSIICCPQGLVFSCPRGNAGMATAGSGDVLTGIITGLLTQGYTPHEAAVMGTWIHATAGDQAALSLGKECMLARDIITKLPEAFNEIRKIKKEFTI